MITYLLLLFISWSDIKIAAFDATSDSSFADRFDVKGYPTIKYFPKGETTNPEDYNGGRTAPEIVQWVCRIMNCF